MTLAETRPFDGGRALMLGGLAAGVLGAALTVVGFMIAPRQTFFSYLTAYNFALSIALGALVLLLICHAMNATWPVAIRRVIEACVATLPLLGLLFVPIFFGLDELYPFMHPERVADLHTRQLLEHKHVWLNRPFFVGRSLFYLSVWAGLALLFRRLSLELDRPGRADAKRTLQVLSCALLPLVAFTLTFASFDWVMALSPDWYSTMFGVYYFSGGFLAAIALVVVLVALAQSGGWLAGIGRSHFYALGRLLLAFVIFWAYIAYFQFFLIWIANKPIEAHWYLDRIRGGFRGVSWFLLIGHFAVPFFALLSYRIKQRGSRLFPVAVWLLFAHYADVHWLIVPSQHATHAFSWLDLTALSAVAGFTLAFGVWRQRGRLLAPVADPSYERALAYESA